jgi:hypothetical protein
MVSSNSIGRTTGKLTPWFQIRLWHLALLVPIVALAICDIQTHARDESVLQLLAAAGYASYFFMAWLIWLKVRPFEKALGLPVLLALFMTAMAVIFFVATLVYLVIEYEYLVGHLF